MRKINRVLVFKLLGITAVILVGVSWNAPRLRPAAQAQGIASRELPLTTAYFYGPVSASANHMVKMCSNNLFGDGSVRLVAAVINAADGRVLADQEMTLPQRGGECLTFRSGESVDVLGVLWSLGGSWGDFTWNSGGRRGRWRRCSSSISWQPSGRNYQHTGRVTVDGNLSVAQRGRSPQGDHLGSAVIVVGLLAARGDAASPHLVSTPPGRGMKPRSTRSRFPRRTRLTRRGQCRRLLLQDSGTPDLSRICRLRGRQGASRLFRLIETARAGGDLGRRARRQASPRDRVRLDHGRGSCVRCRDLL